MVKIILQMLLLCMLSACSNQPPVWVDRKAKQMCQAYGGFPEAGAKTVHVGSYIARCGDGTKIMIDSINMTTTVKGWQDK